MLVCVAASMACSDDGGGDDDKGDDDKGDDDKGDDGGTLLVLVLVYVAR